MSDDPTPSQKPRRGKQKGSIFSATIAALSLFLSALFLISLTGRHLYIGELIGNFRGQMLIMLFPCWLLLLKFRRWKTGLVVGIATLWSTLGVLTVYFPANQPETGPQVIRIMSFNILAHNEDHERVLGRIKQHDPDVVTVLEYANQWPDALEALNSDYPYRITEPRWHGFGIAIFSRYPLEESEVYQLTAKVTDNPTVVTRVCIGNQRLRIAALHVLSPTNPFRLATRNEQLKEFSEILSRSREPTVVMGDFNCTPWSPFLQDFLKTTGYRDSRQGFGFQPTWHATYWPLRIPIDHAFVSEQIHVHDRLIGMPAGSDHLPLVFEVSVSNESEVR